MHFFVLSKIQNILKVEKAKALVYVYTNSCLLCQRPSANPLCYYDDNIFLKDFNDDGEALSKTDDDNNDDNNGNGCKSHDSSDKDASNGQREHRREGPLVNPGNVHHESVYNWNEINKEMANDVDEHTAMGSIRNMHVDEDALVGSTERSYDRANENNDISKGRCLKWLVKTKIRDNV